jgi:transcriptional regulator with XRE-family HTH domain
MIPVTSPKTLGRVLRRYRKDLGITQGDAGRKFNLTQKIVSNIEAGKDGVHVATIFRYMSALGLEMHLEARNKISKDGGLW